jgi:hypothetical protein
MVGRTRKLIGDGSAELCTAPSSAFRRNRDILRDVRVDNLIKYCLLFIQVGLRGGEPPARTPDHSPLKNKREIQRGNEEELSEAYQLHTNMR